MAKKPTGTAVANWDEELAKQAQIAADAEANSGGGQFFSVRAGQLTFNGNRMPDNQMAVIIAGSIFENVFYEGDFDPDSPQSPTCYAFATQEAELEPHKMVVESGGAQNAECKGCKQNEWGTANRGRGKACRNSRRLALLPAGELILQGKTSQFKPYEGEYLEKANFGYLRVPVTSVRSYGGFVKQIAEVLKLPPHGVYCKIEVQPDPKNQVAVNFSPIEEVPRDLLGIVMARHKEAMASIMFPYPQFDEAPAKGKASKGQGRDNRSRARY